MEYSEDLKAYLDGELPAARAEAIRKAAETDPELNREIEQLRMMSGAFATVKREYEPVGLDETLSALDGHRGALRPQTKRKPWFGYGAGLAFAAAIALIVAAPQLFNRPPSRSSSMLASYHRQSMKAESPMATRPMRNGANNTVTTPAPSLAKPPPTLQEQLNDEKAKVQQLEKQVGQLSQSPKMSREPVMPLPAPPAMTGSIVPNGDTVLPETHADIDGTRAVAPKDIAALESQVRKLAMAVGGKVEASGPPVLRVLSITLDASKATDLASRIRTVLNGAGTVSQEAVDAPVEDERTQNARAKIVDLKIEREKLLAEFLPEAPQVQEVNKEIEILQASIKPNTGPAKGRLKVSIG